MQIIPVIDILNGVVVHAKQGRRKHYTPIHSVLCKDCSSESVAASFLSLHPFKTIYIADLNAIMKMGHNDVVIHNLLDKYPNVEFWIDRGLPINLNHPRSKQVIPVIGSESVNAESIDQITSFCFDFILSLDFLEDRILGHEALFSDSNLWPEKVIIMTLSKVGASTGPDIKRLNHFQERWPKTTFIAAGGLRNEKDLELLQNNGIKSVLVASALHSGKLTAENVRNTLPESVASLQHRAKALGSTAVKKILG